MKKIVLIIVLMLCIPVLGQNFNKDPEPAPPPSLDYEKAVTYRMTRLKVVADDGRQVPVYINGSKKGETPFEMDLPHGKYKVSYVPDQEIFALENKNPPVMLQSNACACLIAGLPGLLCNSAQHNVKDKQDLRYQAVYHEVFLNTPEDQVVFPIATTEREIEALNRKIFFKRIGACLVLPAQFVISFALSMY
jgi:hypothetical protein